MSPAKKIRVAVNGDGVIGKRVAAAVARHDDMELAGVAGYQCRLASAHGDAEELLGRSEPIRPGLVNLNIYPLSLLLL